MKVGFMKMAPFILVLRKKYAWLTIIISRYTNGNGTHLMIFLNGIRHPYRSRSYDYRCIYGAQKWYSWICSRDHGLAKVTVHSGGRWKRETHRSGDKQNVAPQIFAKWIREKIRMEVISWSQILFAFSRKLPFMRRWMCWRKAGSDACLSKKR